MAAGRWYPSVAALGNDEAVIVGGGPAIPEVYQTDGTLRRLTNASGVQRSELPLPGATPGWPGGVGGSGKHDEHHQHRAVPES